MESLKRTCTVWILPLLVGIVGGVAMTIVVNVALIEITLNGFWAMFFGCLFCGIGGLLCWNALAMPIPGQDTSGKQKLFCAGCITASGVCCFYVDSSWFIGASLFEKIGMYTILGMALNFGTVFATMDSFVWARSKAIMSYQYEPIKESKEVMFIFIMSLICGCCFGWVFANIPTDPAKARMSLLREEEHCYPIGVFLGGFTGVGYSLITRDTSDLGQAHTYRGIGEQNDNIDNFSFDLDDDI